MSSGTEPSSRTRSSLPSKFVRSCELSESSWSPTAMNRLPSSPKSIAPPWWKSDARCAFCQMKTSLPGITWFPDTVNRLTPSRGSDVV